MRLCFDLYDEDKSGFLGVEKMINMAASLCEIYQNKVAPPPPILSGPQSESTQSRRASTSYDGSSRDKESIPAVPVVKGRKKFRSCSSDVTHHWNAPTFGSLGNTGDASLGDERDDDDEAALLAR